MKRLLRSAFWLLVVATLVAPIPMGESAAAPVPVCCLLNGDHHCVGHEMGGPNAPGLSAQNKCPYAPLALAALQGLHLTPPTRAQLIVTAATSAPIAQESNCTAFSLTTDTRSERGPPAFSL